MGCIDPQNEPGNCPECGMKLVEFEEEEKHKKHKSEDAVGHKAEDFLKKFWLSLILTVIIIIASFYSLGVTLDQLFSLILGSFVFFYGGSVFIVGAYKEIKARNPGMMTLIALAISAAYLYSLFITISGLISIYQRSSSNAFWWELTSLITIMLLGHYFEMKSVSSSQRALKEIEKLLPDQAELEDGKIISINELKINDIVLVRPGGKIPADGIVIEGKSEVNESMITGESKPVLKEVGSEVIAGTINGDGILKIKVTKIGEETFLAGIKKLILEAQRSKSKLQVLADIFAKYLTFIALGIGFLSFIIWLLVQKDIGFALERLVTVLVIACPHALGLAVPLVTLISTTLAVHHGFLVRNRLQFELARKIDIILFDKTGTLTSGKFSIKEIISFQKLNEREILQIAAALSQFSSHFISQGILEKAKEGKIEILKVEDFENLPGRGIRGNINDKVYFLGGDNLLKSLNLIPPKIETIGTIAYLVDEDKNILGAIILEDEVREESIFAIQELHKLGIKIAMITGDKKEVAEKVAQELKIDEYFAEVLPQEKVEKVKELQERNLKVMMVGDGINDAPALMQADVGVAIGTGTNVAIESAGIILIKNDPRDIVSLIKLSRITYRKMIENLFWATGYNVFMIPLAAGILAFKRILPPPALGAIFMSISTIIVAFNALRLRKIKISGRPTFRY